MVIPKQFHKSIYEALLWQLHGKKPTADKMIERVFQRFSFVRGANGIWLHASTLLPARPGLRDEDVQDLPAVSFPVMTVNAKGVSLLKWNTNGDQCRRFARNGPLDGYTPLRGQCSSPIFGVHNDYPNDLALVVRPLNGNGSPFGAKYIPPANWGMSEEDAWRVLEAMFPGLSRSYFELLHSARGCAEAGIGKLPILIVEGPSGSSKTATTKIEARLSGNRWPNMGQQDTDNLAEAFGELAATSTLVVYDEVFKDTSDRHRALVRKFLLNLNRDYSFRKLYVGTVNEPCRTALVLSDVTFPDEIKRDEQFGRRTVHVRLLERVPSDWEEDIKSDADHWMDTGNPKVGVTPEQARAAADVIHSAIVDRHFPAGVQPSFINIARTLGYVTLEVEYQQSECGRQHADAVRLFFAAICEAYKPDEARDKKYGRGFVEFPVGVESSPLKLAAQEMVTTACTGSSAITPDGLRKAFEPVRGTIRQLLGLKAPAQLDIKFSKEGRTLVRFHEVVTHSSRGKAHLINDELATEQTHNMLRELPRPSPPDNKDAAL